MRALAKQTGIQKKPSEGWRQKLLMHSDQEETTVDAHSALGVWGLQIGTLALSKTHVSFSTAGVDEPSVTILLPYYTATAQDKVPPKPPVSLSVPG